MIERRYLSGFGNEHATEALPGTLPEGQNAPQKPPRGLYTEQISGTPFTAPRGHNRRSWLYRIRPSAMHPAFRRIGRLVGEGQRVPSEPVRRGSDLVEGVAADEPVVDPAEDGVHR